MKPHDGVAVITGAGGIGLACARRFVDLDVILADVTRDILEMAISCLESQNVSGIVCDVSSAESVAGLVRAAEERGPIRALVHTAGLSGTLCSSEDVLRVNLGGAVNVLEAFGEVMAPGSAGVFIASIGGHQRFAREVDALLTSVDPLKAIVDAGLLKLGPSAAYGVAKRGVTVQCEIRAQEWGKRGNRLVSLSPGLIEDTLMGAAARDHGPGRLYATWSALGRNGRSDEVARVVKFLCSEEASFITGIDLLVDGGLIAGIQRHVDMETRLRWHACVYPAPSVRGEVPHG